MGLLHTFYNICIAVGLIVPLISLLLGGMDALAGDVDFDGADGGTSAIPFNFNALLFALVAVGAAGKLLGHYLNPWLSLAIALVLGAGAYFLIYRFLILPLKKSNPRAISGRDLLCRQVEVCTRIPVGGTGEVALTDAAGSRITYLTRYEYADFEQRLPIEPGTMVKILDIDGSTLVAGRIF